MKLVQITVTFVRIDKDIDRVCSARVHYFELFALDVYDRAVRQPPTRYVPVLQICAARRFVAATIVTSATITGYSTLAYYLPLGIVCLVVDVGHCYVCEHRYA